MDAALPEGWTLTVESPLGEDLTLLHQRHSEAMHAESPPEAIHMLPPDKLVSPAITFFVLRDDRGAAVGMGAIKRISDAHAEIKSMHILRELRGKGLSRLILAQLMEVARAAGYVRVSLETGSQPAFAPARALYARAGFAECEAFEGYRPDPASTFMTIAL